MQKDPTNSLLNQHNENFYFVCMVLTKGNNPRTIMKKLLLMCLLTCTVSHAMNHKKRFMLSNGTIDFIFPSVERFPDCNSYCCTQKTTLMQYSDREDPHCTNPQSKNCLKASTVRDSYEKCLQWCLTFKK